MATQQNGIITTDFGSNDLAEAIAIQTDGKILVAGKSYNGSNYDFGLVRYNSNGSLDTSFGTNGKLTTAIGSGSDVANALLLQTDGKILVVGGSYNNGVYNASLVRYTVNGLLDSSFAGTGKINTSISGSVATSDFAKSVSLQTDGKILVGVDSFNSNAYAGDFALLRYNSDGSLDSNFDADGKVVTPLSSSTYMPDEVLHDTVVQPDGKILAVGSINTSNTNQTYDLALVRYNSNGSLDTGFAGTGKVITDIGSSTQSEWANKIALQSDGKILVTGFSGDNHDIALLRYNINGSLDTSFDGDGKALTDFGDNDYATSITIQTDGKVLVAGISTVPSVGMTTNHNDIVVARYNIDGSLDTSFSGDGKAVISTSYLTIPREMTDAALTIQSDGRILVTGSIFNGNNLDFGLMRLNVDGSIDTTFGASNPVNNNTPKLFISDWRGLEDATGHGVNTGTNASNYSSSVRVFLTSAATTDVTFTAALQYGTASTADVTGLSTTGQTFTIAAGQTSVEIPITLIRDYAKESPETFNVLLSNVTGATATRNSATGVIIDNDTDMNYVESTVVGYVGGDTTDFLATGTNYSGTGIPRGAVHTGLDVNGATNPENNHASPVFGEVVRVSGQSNSIGGGISIKLPAAYGHNSDMFILFHNTSADVQVGQIVRIGDIVGDFNPTSFSPHVHLESNTDGSQYASTWIYSATNISLQDPRIPIAIADSNRTVSPVVGSGDTKTAAEPLGLMALGTTELYDAIGIVFMSATKVILLHGYHGIQRPEQRLILIRYYTSITQMVRKLRTP